MRPKFLICISALVLVFCVILFLWQSRQNKTTLELPQKKNQPAPSISVIIAKTNGMIQTVMPSLTNPQPFVNDRLKTNAIRQYMESLNKPVEFFGQVIDQDGSPLAGVSIRGEALHVKVIVPTAWGDEDEIIPIEKITDSAGRFEIEGISGRSFDLESIQKSSYDVELGNCPHVFAPSTGTFEKPTVFKMWSTNIHEQLITGNKSFEIIPDGRLYFINLTDGAISEHEIGDLKIWIQYTNQVVQGQLYDWSAGIEAVSGGLQEAPQAAINSGFWPEPRFAMYVAPEDGYVPSFSLKSQIKGGQDGEIGNRYFYLLLKGGKEYGRMSINLFAPYGHLHPGLIRLYYAINPSGSRILR